MQLYNNGLVLDTFNIFNSYIISTMRRPLIRIKIILFIQFLFICGDVVSAYPKREKERFYVGMYNSLMNSFLLRQSKNFRDVFRFGIQISRPKDH